MARASFLSRLCPASCRRVGGALMLILKDLQGKEPGKYQEEAACQPTPMEPPVLISKPPSSWD
jgi:hypothetical protein